jgi:hypothetical protein
MHILSAGLEGRNPKVRLFHGAIGNAYHWLYEPLMSYKDELALILGNSIQDLASNLIEKNTKAKETIKDKNQIIENLTKENEELRNKLNGLIIE